MGAVERLSVHISMVFAAVAVLGWIGLMAQPSGWIRKQSVAYTIDCGLTQVQLSEGVGVTAAGAAVGLISAKAGEKVTKFGPYGTFGMQEWSQRMCSLKLLDYVPGKAGAAANLCGIWEGVQYASTALVIGASLGLVVYTCGVAMLAYWYYVKARASLRLWMRGVLLAGVLLLGLSAVQYALVTMNVSQMPPEGGSTVGPNLMHALSLCGAAAVPLIIVLLVLDTSIEEAFHEHLSEQKKLAREQEKLYGSADQEAPAPQAVGGPDAGWAAWAGWGYAPEPYTAPAFPQKGYQEQSGYLQMAGGYPQQAGYPQQQAGYPQQQAGYPQQGALQPQGGYPQVSYADASFQGVGLLQAGPVIGALAPEPSSPEVNCDHRAALAVVLDVPATAPAPAPQPAPAHTASTAERPTFDDPADVMPALPSMV